jgi:O-antigen/teichoic acid export membrane protein
VKPRKQVFNTALVATIGFIVLRFLVTPLRIKAVTSVLAPEGYGMLTLVSMTAHAAALLLSLGGYDVLLRRLAGQGRPFQHAYLRAVLLLTLLVAVPIGCLTYISMLWLGSGVSGVWLAPGGVMAYTAFFILAQLLMYYLLGTESTILARLLQLLWWDLWFVPLLILAGISGMAASRALFVWTVWLGVGTLGLLGYIWPFNRKGHPRVPLKVLVYDGLPIVPVLSGEWLIRIGGHYLVLFFVGARTMADYALAMNIAFVGVIAGTPLVEMACVKIGKALSVENHHDGVSESVRKPLTQAVRQIFYIASTVALAMFFLRNEIVLFLSNERFLSATELMPVFALLPLLLLFNVFFARLLMLYAQRNVVVRGAISGAVGTLLFGVLGVVVFGVYGVGVVLLIGLACVDVYYFRKLRFRELVSGVGLRFDCLFAYVCVVAVLFGGISRLPFGGCVLKVGAAAVISLLVAGICGVLKRDDYLEGFVES